MTRKRMRYSHDETHVQKGQHVAKSPATCSKLQMLAHAGVPRAVFRLALLALMLDVPSTPVRHVELFSGVQSITNAFLQRGFTAIAFDILNDNVHQNILSAQGFLSATLHILSIADGGGMFAAPVCSSWVWLNRATSGRKNYDPNGADHEYVRLANIMVARVAMLIWLAHGLGHIWVLEQPQSSIMEMHKRMQELIAKTKVYKVAVSLGRYGASTAKEIWLYSNYNNISTIKIFSTTDLPQDSKKLVEKTSNSHGRKCIQGNAGLKESQAYPKDFGNAIAMLHSCFYEQQCCASAARRAHSSTIDIQAGCAAAMADGADWHDAALDHVWRVLQM